LGLFQIIFIATDGDGYQGDIAIDHILLFEHECGMYELIIGEMNLSFDHSNTI